MSAFLLALGLVGAPGVADLSVRAAAGAAPCLRAAAEDYEKTTGRRVAVEVGPLRAGSADVLVGFSAEVTRAVESGAAVLGSDADIARVPWVLAVRGDEPPAVRSLDDVARLDLEVWILGDGTAPEARRALEGRARVRVTGDAAALRAVRAALVPVSLADGATRVTVDVRPLVAAAAVGARAAQPEAARAFVGFLASDAGQQAFAACGEGR